MSDLKTAPQLLTHAADILTAQGWKQEGDYEYLPYLPPEHCPVDLGTALALASGVDMHSHAATSPTGVHADAVMLLAANVLPDYKPTLLPVQQRFDALINWQDEEGRTAEQVIAALRAAASPAPAAAEKSPVQELAAAIIGALDLPRADIGSDVRRYLVMRDRVACVLGNMERLAADGSEDIFRHILARLAEVPTDAPVTYPTRNERAGGAL